MSENTKRNIDLDVVKLSLTELEQEFIMYGEFINQCINKKGVMTYPEIKTATKLWLETRKTLNIK